MNTPNENNADHAKMAERLIEVNAELTKLASIKRVLGDKKQQMQERLSKLTNQVQVAGRMRDSEYTAICHQQRQLKSKIHEMQPEFSSLKEKMRDLSSEETELRVRMFGITNNRDMAFCSAVASAPLADRITQLKSKYAAFASDPTRISSMRLMSSQFVEELNRALAG